MTDKAKELAEKLYALAKGGAQYERQSAEQFLEKHLAKFGLTVAEFEAQAQEKVAYDYHFTSSTKDTKPTEKGRFNNQIVANVIGSKRQAEVGIYKNGSGFWGTVLVTVAERIEIIAKTEFYWNLYQEEKEIFFSAFIQTNHLYGDGSRDKGDDEKDDPKELERTRRILEMAGSIKKETFRKQLNG